jgi:GrpB-like predicted nucleotidyltransferase (UPF0157 family)
VPGLAAKPVLDIDLAVSGLRCREQDYVPALETIGFQRAIRDPCWLGHQARQADEPGHVRVVCLAAGRADNFGAK